MVNSTGHRRASRRILIPVALAAGLTLAASAMAGIPSHLSVHAGILPPVDLTRALHDNGSILKGMSPADEEVLLGVLERAGLRSTILKVAVARYEHAPVALVKLQAGNSQSRMFNLSETERDAMLALHSAFNVPTELRHVDLWSVVPEQGEDGQEWHRPVFSVAAERQHFLKVARATPPTDRRFLAELSAVRYDPVFTRHATDWTAAESSMPRTAYTFHRLADQWRMLVTDGVSRVSDLVDSTPVQVAMQGPRTDRRVALTIDDGPRPLLTPLFLDILRRENVKATFFVVGEKAEEYPGLIREIAREGHELANHTYSHRRFSTLAPEEVYAEIRGCSKIVGTLTGQRVRFMRPPGGDYTSASLKVCESLGLITALWTHNTGDWARPEPAAIAYNATHDLKGGDIILMHQGDMRSVQALPMIIERIRARRLEPATMGEVVRNGSISKLSLASAMAQRGRLSLTE